MEGNTKWIQVIVRSVTFEAKDVNSWEFCRPNGADLPPFAAGAHIDLKLNNGIIRSYSLCNAQDERDRYVIAVNKDPASRGGSKGIHENLKVGDEIAISPPSNNFPLVEDAKHVAFIAGGIGITPLWCMIQRLEKLGRSWELYYSARNRHACAFKEKLETLERQKPGRISFNFDQEPGGKVTDLEVLIDKIPNHTELYCCGPGAMLRAFETAARESKRHNARVHVEYFTAKDVPASYGGFTLVLARSGRTFEVPVGKTILNTLLDNNIDVPFACMEGACGTCEIRVVEGIPDHRDSVLTASERSSNETIMICCSGCKSAKLVLDL
jgi:tetrachlorobenzoquinone reductase